MTISYTIVDCVLGRMIVGRTAKGVCSVAFGDNDLKLIGNLRNEYSKGEIVRDDKSLRAYVEQILDHLSCKSKRLDLPLDIQATAFQLQVWELLRKIPFGETVSYGELAEKLSDRKKVRAVAGACASNRVAVVIPCHRVIASDGKLSGYRWGVERKAVLLEIESRERTLIQER